MGYCGVVLYRRLMCESCNEVTLENIGDLKGWNMAQSFLAYHFTRSYPGWATWLPQHVPRLMAARPFEPALAAAAKDRK